jgi:hypothetical protein
LARSPGGEAEEYVRKALLEFPAGTTDEED